MKRALLFAAACAACVLAYLFLLSLTKGQPSEVSLVLPALFLAVATAAVNRSFFRAEGLSLAAIGIDQPKRRLGQFAAAFAGGAATVVLWAFLLRMVAAPRWITNAGFDGRGAVSRVLFALFNNGGEELVYRGYLLWKIAQRFGGPAAVLSTSLLFALLHVQAGVPVSSAATVVFTSGILFGVLMLRWRSLPLVLGFHVATNVVQELLGLRVTALTVWRPELPAEPDPARRAALLIAMAVLNLAIAGVVIRTRGRRAGIR